jgi:hypothetical protein
MHVLLPALLTALAQRRGRGGGHRGHAPSTGRGLSRQAKGPYHPIGDRSDSVFRTENGRVSGHSQAPTVGCQQTGRCRTEARASVLTCFGHHPPALDGRDDTVNTCSGCIANFQEVLCRYLCVLRTRSSNASPG